MSRIDCGFVSISIILQIHNHFGLITKRMCCTRGILFHMNTKELKRLSRRELIEIIYQMKKNEQKMQEKITKLQSELDDKRLHISQAGSIAEAAASVSGLLAAAQTTADLYLQEIACIKEETRQACDKLIEDTQREAARYLAANAPAR